MPEPLEPERTVSAPDRDASASAASDRDETATTTPRAGSAAPTFGPPAAAGEVGTLGPYRVVKQLGAGGMGAVYLAVDTRLDRKLALKVMLPEFAVDRDAKERFLREARAAAKITHDNVVIVHEADEREGVPYIAMQFLQGYPLDEYLKTKGTPPLAHVIRIARETALGLAAAHAMGLVHRDIKPANLWLEAPNGRVKVLDFGLAKPVGTDTELTKSGAVVGTPAYMSPEQARGVKVDHRTDLFSLGCVLYRLCTGKTPFAGPNVMAVMMALGNDDPTPVRELNPSVPEALAELIHQLLAKKPEARPQTANEVAKRLRTTLDQLLAPPPTAVASSGSVPAVSAADLSASQPVVVHPVPHQPPIVVPMHVTAAPDNAFASLGDDATTSAAAEPASAAPKPERKKGGKGLLLAVGGAVLLAGVAVAVVVSQMGKKGEPVAEQKPPVVQTPPKDDGKPPAGSIPVLKPIGSEWVDVLALDEKLAEGYPNFAAWTKRNGKWTSQGGDGTFSAVALPLRATGSYKLTAEVSHDAGANYFGIVLPVGYDRAVSFGFNGFYGTVGGFHLLAGRDTNDPRNPTHTPQTPVPPGRIVKLDLAVTLTGDQVELRAAVDGGAPIVWAGAVADVAPGPNQPFVPGRIGLGANITQWTVHSLKFQKIDGEAGVLGWGPPGSDPNRRSVEWVLSVGGNVRVNGGEWNKAVTELPKRWFASTEVNLSWTRVTDADLTNLKELKGLTSLGLSNTKLTDAGLAHLKDCKELVQLDLRGTKVTAQGLGEFAAAMPRCRIEHDGGVIEPKVVADPDRKAAEWVIAQGGSVRVKEVDGEIKAAADLPKDRFALTHVIVGGMQVTDAGLEHLKGLKNLKHLGLYDVPVTDAGLVHIKELTTLTELIVGGAKVTGSGLIHLKNLTALTNVTLVRGPLTDAGLAHLKDLKGLRTLSLEWTKVTDTGLEHIKELKSLTNLSLFGTAVTDAGLVHLKELRSLEALWLTGTKVSDAGLAQLKELKSLTVLELGQTAVTGAGLAHLKDLKSLMNLGLGGASVSDVGLVHLQELKNLTFLTLGSTNVSDAGLADVKELKALTFLDLRKTKVTAKGVAELAVAVLGCKIVHDGGTIEPKK